MKKSNAVYLLAGILNFIVLTTAFTPLQALELNKQNLKLQAFYILDSKCNVCHRKKNRFRVFSLKNMDRQASKIHQQVFIKKRMPKGDEIKLSEAEYQTLKDWLTSKNIK